VGPIVLLTMTVRWTFACRHCWATVRATPKSAIGAAAAGGALGLPLDLWRLSRPHYVHAPGSFTAALAFVFGRFFPRFEVVDPPVDAGTREIPPSARMGA
jgi:hypothetical protein